MGGIYTSHLRLWNWLRGIRFWLIGPVYLPCFRSPLPATVTAEALELVERCTVLADRSSTSSLLSLSSACHGHKRGSETG